MAAYDDVGTSYQMNWLWYYQTKLDPGNADDNLPGVRVERGR